MQDVADEHGGSRGGVYLYFPSMDKLFQEVIKKRNKEKFSIISKAIQDNEPFKTVLANYMALQKERLLCIENSLFRAYCEYIFSKPKKAVQAFRDMQLNPLRKSVMSIFTLGVNQNVIRNENISQLVDHFIIVIDGLSVLALAEALTEEVVNEQFALLESLVRNIDTNSD